ncbi:MAG TPA: YgaP-like transmembrane domain [Terriglobia bacterium]|nr:YgaP-like transmembrane domain [Terriglobia bacterium]
MALVRNLGNTDRRLRIQIGALLCVVAFLVRAHLLGALALAAGIILAIEGMLGH